METRTFTKTDALTGMEFTSEAYTEDGKVWRWTSNGNPVPVDAAEEYGIPIDPVEHAKAREAHLSEFAASYREFRETHGYSGEELFEARAAHGPGVELVDVISGHRFTT